MSEIKSTQYIAVKALIRDAAGRVLVLRQAVEPGVDGGGKYHPPGGIVEPGETLAEAISREVLEETGLTVAVGQLITVAEWRATLASGPGQFVGIFYECTLAEPGRPIVLQVAEASEYAWVGADNFDGISFVEPAGSVVKRYLEQSHVTK